MIAVLHILHSVVNSGFVVILIVVSMVVVELALKRGLVNPPSD